MGSTSFPKPTDTFQTIKPQEDAQARLFPIAHQHKPFYLVSASKLFFISEDKDVVTDNIIVFICCV